MEEEFEFMEAIFTGGDIEVIKKYKGHLDYNDNIYLDMAINYNRIDVIRYFLERGVIPTFKSIKQACIKGHDHIVRLLLDQPSIDPSGEDNYLIRWSSLNKHYELTDHLLRDSRVESTLDFMTDLIAEVRSNLRDEKLKQLI